MADQWGFVRRLPQGFDFPLKQQSRISALQRQTPSLLFLPLLPPTPPCLSDVTGVDFIHVHKGSPTLESPRRRLLLVCAMVTTTNKGQSPMVMANWVCSHYWPCEQWSTDGDLPSLMPGLHSSPEEAPGPHRAILSLCLSLSFCLSSHRPVHRSITRGSCIRRPVAAASQERCQSRPDRLTISANCLINDSPVLGCSSTSLWGANCSDWFASVNYWWRQWVEVLTPGFGGPNGPAFPSSYTLLSHTPWDRAPVWRRGAGASPLLLFSESGCSVPRGDGCDLWLWGY